MSEFDHQDSELEERLRAHYQTTLGETSQPSQTWERISTDLAQNRSEFSRDEQPGGAEKRPVGMPARKANRHSVVGTSRPRISLPLIATLALAVGGLLVLWLTLSNRREETVPPALTSLATATVEVSANTRHTPGDIVTEVDADAWQLTDFRGYRTSYLFDSGTDEDASHTGKPSAFIRVREPGPANLKTIATLQRSVPLTDYVGSRIRFSAYLKAEDVGQDAGLWIEVVNPVTRSLRLADTWDKPIQGTHDWQRYELVLDVPQGSNHALLGSYLEGDGAVWINDARIEVVGNDVPSTAKRPPYNPGFEEGERGWRLDDRTDRDMNKITTLDWSTAHTGNASLSVATDVFSGTSYSGNLFGAGQSFAADEYHGRRLRFSMYVKTEAEAEAYISIRVSKYMPNGPWRDVLFGYDSMLDRPIARTTDWQRYEVVIDVPEEANTVGVSFHARGNGRAWFDDAQLEVVGDDVPVTGMTVLREPHNLSFEEGMSSWHFYSSVYEAGVDKSAARDGQVSIYLTGKDPQVRSQGMLYQTIFANGYWGKRVRFSAYVRTAGAVDGGVFRVETIPPNSAMQIEETPIEDTSAWKRYERIVDVPQGSYTIKFGVAMEGVGKMWFDDVRIEEVGPIPPTATFPISP
jgi:hypothetical protein